MTGGIEKGAQINRRLALAAQKFNIPMGVGSQRIALDNDDFSSVFAVKKHAPDVFLIGNLGFAQLRQDNYLALCHRAIDMIDADALAIHVNVLQESIQMEGDRNFSGIVERLYTVCDKIDKPIIIKEVGAGISPDTVKRLLDAGVAAVDIGGRGGTSWGYIEGLRSSSAQTKALAESFRDWGIPTAYSLASAREVAPSLPLIATGGIRDGHTVAKAVALGADMVGVGLPLLKAALDGEEQPQEVLSTLARGLKIAMIATGSTRLNQLAQHIALGVPMERRFEALLLR
jgi:isopentenyl-diphosphate delta-isomerase